MKFDDIDMFGGGDEKLEPTKILAHEVVDLSRFQLHELLQIRDQIDARLPAVALKDMDLEQELVLQLLKAKGLQEETLSNSRIAANQRAQVLSAVASVIDRLIQMQVKFYTPERFKRIEALMISAMKEMPLEQAGRFLDQYEALAEGG